MSKPSFPPYNVGDLAGAVRREAPAAARNVGPIGDVLAEWLPAHGIILEVASGTGEHALAFAGRFPTIEWQPSDPDPAALASIEAWRAGGPPNLLPAVQIDVRNGDWPVESAAAIVSINMVHISPWEASLGLLDGAARWLAPGAPLILYGPWIVEGVATSPSNLAFDASLKARDPSWGLRSLAVFAGAATLRGFALGDVSVMPANNVMLRFYRQDA